MFTQGRISHLLACLHTVVTVALRPFSRIWKTIILISLTSLSHSLSSTCRPMG